MQEQNPFHPLSPPDDPTLFYGRSDEIAFLRQHLVGANNQHVIIVLGRAGMGKTALLHQIDYIVDERYQTIYIDVGGIRPFSVKSLIEGFSQQIVTRMEMIRASTYRIPDFPEEADDERLYEWFADEFLDVALTAIHRDRFLLLLLDDLHLLIDAVQDDILPERFLAYLGELLKKYDRLDIVGALDIAFETDALDYEVLANVNHHVRLQPLDKSTARQLITEPVAEKYSYTEDMLDGILKLCGGFPFLIHSVCRLLHRQWEVHPQMSILPAEMLEMVYPAALEETSTVTVPLLEGITPNMRAVLDTMLDHHATAPTSPVTAHQLQQGLKRHKARLNRTQLASTLRKLEYQAVIYPVNVTSYAFRTQLEADWLLAQRREAADGNPRRLNMQRVVGGIVVLAAVLLVIAIIAFGVLETGGQHDQSDLPPTSTLEQRTDPTTSN